MCRQIEYPPNSNKNGRAVLPLLLTTMTTRPCLLNICFMEFLCKYNIEEEEGALGQIFHVTFSLQ